MPIALGHGARTLRADRHSRCPPLATVPLVPIPPTIPCPPDPGESFIGSCAITRSPGALRTMRLLGTTDAGIGRAWPRARHCPRRSEVRMLDQPGQNGAARRGHTQPGRAQHHQRGLIGIDLRSDHIRTLPHILERVKTRPRAVKLFPYAKVARCSRRSISTAGRLRAPLAGAPIRSCSWWVRFGADLKPSVARPAKSWRSQHLNPAEGTRDWPALPDDGHRDWLRTKSRQRATSPDRDR
jgi:hypothetical protein